MTVSDEPMKNMHAHLGLCFLSRSQLLICLVHLQATPTPEELELMSNMIGRVRRLCRTAADANLRIMIDAEHQYFQPAIDSIAKDMMAEFNADEPVVLNTYQCYLKDSRFRLNADIESARRQVQLLCPLYCLTMSTRLPAGNQ